MQMSPRLHHTRVQRFLWAVAEAVKVLDLQEGEDFEVDGNNLGPNDYYCQDFSSLKFQSEEVKQKFRIMVISMLNNAAFQSPR